MKKKELIESLVYIVEEEVKTSMPKMVKREVMKTIKPLLREIALLKRENKLMLKEIKSLENTYTPPPITENVVTSGLAIVDMPETIPSILEGESAIDYTKRMINEQKNGIPQGESYPNMGTSVYTSDNTHTVAAGGHIDRTPSVSPDNMPITAPIPAAVSANLNKDYSKLMGAINNR